MKHLQLGLKKTSSNTPAAQNLAKSFYSARKFNFLSQGEVAKQLQVDISFVGRTEKGERVPDLVELYWLCSVLKVDIEVLLKQVMSDLNVNNSE